MPLTRAPAHKFRWVTPHYVHGHVLSQKDATGTCRYQPIKPRAVPRGRLPLSYQESWIVDLIACFGLTDFQIALAVGITEDAVGSSLRVAMNKTGLSTRLDLAKWRLSPR